MVMVIRFYWTSRIALVRSSLLAEAFRFHWKNLPLYYLELPSGLNVAMELLTPALLSVKKCLLGSSILRLVVSFVVLVMVGIPSDKDGLSRYSSMCRELDQLYSAPRPIAYSVVTSVMAPRMVQWPCLIIFAPRNSKTAHVE